MLNLVSQSNSNNLEKWVSQLVIVAFKKEKEKEKNTSHCWRVDQLKDNVISGPKIELD